MKLIYIAGPYTADTTWEVRMNILRAEMTAAAVCSCDNAFPVTPHLNTPFFEGLRDGQFFVDGTLQIMMRCDAVLIVQNDSMTGAIDITESSGTHGEVETAVDMGIPVFYSLLDLRRWLNGEKLKKKDEPRRTLMSWIRGKFHGQL